MQRNRTGCHFAADSTEDGEDDYWSLEILGDSPWEDGTVISLTLQREEWGDCTSWQAEATLADGTVENYSELPLTRDGTG